MVLLSAASSVPRGRAYTREMEPAPDRGEPEAPGPSDAAPGDPVSGDATCGDATRLLRLAHGADPEGQRALFALLFQELHGLAGRAMAREDDGHTLQPTALLNEVWLRLFASDTHEFEDRRHFLTVAAKVMRQVLVDHARAKQRIKRGGAWRRVELDDPEAAAARGLPADGLDLVELDAALEELRVAAPRPAQVVELRFFGGLEVEEVAAVLGASISTVAREWRFARAWLLDRLGGD
jgi:RNA polymerase sigma-70 factor (ECF subfamily)